MSTPSAPVKTGTDILGPVNGRHAEILTPPALAFLSDLARTFEGRRQDLLARRKVRQKELDNGALPDFLPSTASIRAQRVDRCVDSRDLRTAALRLRGPWTAR